MYSFSYKVQFTTEDIKEVHDEAGYYTPQNVAHLRRSSSWTHRQRFGVSIFQNAKCPVTNVTLTAALMATSGNPGQRWESSSAEFNLSTSCSTSATCASQAENPPPPPANHKNTHSCDLPSRQRTSTWQSWKNSGWWGGEVRARPRVSSQRNQKKKVTECVIHRFYKPCLLPRSFLLPNSLRKITWKHEQKWPPQKKSQIKSTL